MNRLTVSNLLFERLAFNPPKWWDTLVNDKDIVIQIRKNNYIDAYFNGGNIIRKLVFDGNHFKGETHYKYIPMERGMGDYVPFLFENDSIEFGEVKPMRLGHFSKDSLKEMKENISKYYPTDSEKAIQYTFIKNDPFFIDSEFEYSYKDGNETKTIRIDLVRLDIAEKRIVFVEVKTIGDCRLFNNEIISQLKDYKNFITSYKADLLTYYKKVLVIKRNLKILPECIKSEAIDNYQILDRPLLLFGDCEQSWINKFSSELDDKIKTCAVGCYYFGKPEYRCELIKKSNRNRHIFCDICN